MGRKLNRMAIRDNDLLVAVGGDIRITSFRNGEEWRVENGLIGSYKVRRVLLRVTQNSKLAT